MVMVRIIQVVKVPLGLPKPVDLPKLLRASNQPRELKVVMLPSLKDEAVLEKQRELVARMPR